MEDELEKRIKSRGTKSGGLKGVFSSSFEPPIKEGVPIEEVAYEPPPRKTNWVNVSIGIFLIILGFGMHFAEKVHPLLGLLNWPLIIIGVLIIWRGSKKKRKGEL